MSRQTAQLLENFEALPEDEKRIFTVEFLGRANNFLIEEMPRFNQISSFDKRPPTGI